MGRSVAIAAIDGDHVSRARCDAGDFGDHGYGATFKAGLRDHRCLLCLSRRLGAVIMAESVAAAAICGDQASGQRCGAEIYGDHHRESLCGGFVGRDQPVIIGVRGHCVSGESSMDGDGE